MKYLAPGSSDVLYICTCPHPHILHACTSANYICIRIYVRERIYVTNILRGFAYLYACAYMSAHIHVYIDYTLYTYTYTYVYIYTYTHIYVYTPIVRIGVHMNTSGCFVVVLFRQAKS